MKVGASARKLAGFLAEHAAAFKEVARQQNCIIMSRAPGIFVPGLISDGYASKGFHNKAKSSNWGPMAGFVLFEAFFSKIGLTEKGLKSQKKYIVSALTEGATPLLLFITDARRNWLEVNNYIKRYNPNNQPIGKKGSQVIRFQATMLGCKGDYLETAENYIFTLKETQIGNETLWAVYYQETDQKKIKPVKALRDPNWANIEVIQNNNGVQVQLVGGMPDHKKATTGDYDLFAVWGPNNVNPNEYKRPVSAMDINSIPDLDSKEDPERGNISQYLDNICNLLNQAVRRVRWGNVRYAYTGGDMVHHSDEAGRPFIDEIDFPFIAFFPPNLCDIKGAEGNTIVAFEKVEEFRTLIEAAIKWNYNIELNPGWIDELSGGKKNLKQRYQQYVIQGREYQGIL